MRQAGRRHQRGGAGKNPGDRKARPHQRGRRPGNARRQRGARHGAGAFLHRRAALAGNRHHRRPRLHAGAARRPRGSGRRHRLEYAGQRRAAQERTMARLVRRRRRRIRFRRRGQLRRARRASRGARHARLSGRARAAVDPGQRQLFHLRGQAGVLAADLSDADRRRARRACDARSRRPHAVRAGRGMGRARELRRRSDAREFVL